jgi:glycosyltransferase involved in cell wall biosynthesis
MKKILVVHNYYQKEGGEDQVFRCESKLLKSKGHDVVQFTVNNNELNNQSPWRAAKNSLWNNKICFELDSLIQRERPSLVHFHNTFPMISPGAYSTVRKFNIPVVQTLHNYRLICPNAILSRASQVCEACVGKFIALPAIQHSCYRGNKKATATVVAMLAYHRIRGTWVRDVDQYIALTEFMRDKLVQGGLPKDRISVKPNFTFESEFGTAPLPREDFALFIGRLEAEKGIETLLRAWIEYDISIPLVIVGSGALASKVGGACAQRRTISFLGALKQDEVRKLMKRARFLVLPSEWYEGFPMVVVEAFSEGLPVLGAAHGAMASIIQPGETGQLFRPADPGDLASKAMALIDNLEILECMGHNAQRRFLECYSPESNYRSLISIYERALANFSPVC